MHMIMVTVFSTQAGYSAGFEQGGQQNSTSTLDESTPAADGNGVDVPISSSSAEIKQSTSSTSSPFSSEISSVDEDQTRVEEKQQLN